MESMVLFNRSFSAPIIHIPLICYNQASADPVWLKTDPVIPFDKAKLSFDWVQKNGIKGSFHQYKGLAHGASDKELTDVAAWIKSVLSDPKL